MSNVIEIPTRPGLISALVFIVFDLLLLTLLDGSLARVINALYYRRIFRNGKALQVKSADVPCLTTFLVGERLALVNIFVVLLKLGILASMLYVDLSINSRLRTDRSGISLSSTFGFNLSEAEWKTTSDATFTESSAPIEDPLIRVVERRWVEVRECRQVEQASDMFNITFYALGFNLNGNVVLDDERKPKGTPTIPPNTTTLTCLKPGNVEEPVVTTVVSGCSHFRDGPCPAISSQSVELDLLFRKYFIGTHKVPEGSSEVTFMLFAYPPEVWRDVLPSYDTPNATLTCSRTTFQVSMTNSSESDLLNGDLGNAKELMTCIFIVPVNNTTLVEKWDYSSSSKLLTRDFPGPVFDGVIDIGRHQQANLLFNLFRETNWLTLASIIVAEGSVYRRFTDKTFTKLDSTNTITIISYPAIFLLVILIFIIVVLYIAVAKAFSRDQRPQINSINGLSSIAREEAVPTGRSICRGSTSFVGLMISNNGHLRFGALTDPNFAVRPIKGVDII